MTTDTEALRAQFERDQHAAYRNEPGTFDSWDAYQAGHAAALAAQKAPAVNDNAASDSAVNDNAVLLDLVARIRAAAGDPNGRLMQDELIEHIAGLRAADTADHFRGARKMVGAPDAGGPEPVAWRLTNTAFRKPQFEYHDTREHAEQRQEDFNRSVDDGGMHDLTPLYTAAQLAAATQWPAWTPASTLPPSGKRVIATYINSIGNRRTIVAMWIAAKTREADSESDNFEYDDATDTCYVPQGWYECIYNWDDYSSVAVYEGEITHWMPLPPAPEAVPHTNKPTTA